jgi:hypothetical protein
LPDRYLRMLVARQFVSNSIQQDIRPERFPQESGAGIDAAVTQNAIGVAGHVQVTELRLVLAAAANHFRPLDARHHDVGKQQRNGSCLLADADGFAAVNSRENVVLVRKYSAQQQQNRGIVIYDQNPGFGWLALVVIGHALLRSLLKCCRRV